jgi:hypothetical protein
MNAHTCDEDPLLAVVQGQRRAAPGLLRLASGIVCQDREPEQQRCRDQQQQRSRAPERGQFCDQVCVRACSEI